MILIVWGEKYQKGATPDEVNIQFDRAFQVKVYNPAQYDPQDTEKGTRPVKTYPHAKSISLPVLNHPFILELTPDTASKVETRFIASPITVNETTAIK
jgi:hypothetical protein